MHAHFSPLHMPARAVFAAAGSVAYHDGVAGG